MTFLITGTYLSWLAKETLQTFSANGSNRNVEIWYLLYSNKWIIATKLFASSIIVFFFFFFFFYDALWDDVICVNSI